MRLWLPFLSGESGCQGQPLRHPRIHGDGQPFQSAAISPAASGKEIEGDRFIRLRRGRKEKHLQRSLSNSDWPVNVWEWCKDVWNEGIYSDPGTSPTDPVATSGSNLRVIRGGSWYQGPGTWRSAYRKGYEPNRRAYCLGMRPVFYPLP